VVDPRRQVLAERNPADFRARPGGVISAVAAAGSPALLGAAAIGVLVLTAMCWVIVNKDRTANLVAIISALRRRAR
jgi:hypothetical protein